MPPGPWRMIVSQRSIEAFNLPERVVAYDADMRLMHPNRAKMVEIALEVLPFELDSELRALDLGCGTGFFAERFLEAYPRSQVIAMDGAEAMVEMAKTRLRAAGERVECRMGDLREVSKLLAGAEGVDVAYSSYALHHLERDEKVALVSDVVSLLKPGGWFVNADVIAAGSPDLEIRFQELRVMGIVERAAGKDPRFADYTTGRRYLDEMEAHEGDQPLTLGEDLQVLTEGGLRDAAVFWLEYREAVTGGLK